MKKEVKGKRLENMQIVIMNGKNLEKAEEVIFPALGK